MFKRLLRKSTDKFTLIVSDQHRYVWFKVRKCGSTSITEVLPKPARDFATRDYKASDYPGYFKFSFVRNPYDRLLSNYLNKIKGQRREDIRAGYLKNLDFWEGMSFDDFAYQVCDLPDDKCDRHYKSMHKVFDVEGVDFIGRLENFTEDMNFVLRAISGEESTPIPHKNRTQKASYTEYFSDQLRDRVTLRYKADLELFDYSFAQE
ncbi:MAG: sulfotransferase family 2 domain-containing protein [Halieaceae bacterium]|jgi:hypothetical protein|nr:sulfotransferase family 2 domain-containing protein [Halieaceae bacterium]